MGETAFDCKSGSNVKWECRASCLFAWSPPPDVPTALTWLVVPAVTLEIAHITSVLAATSAPCTI